MTTSYPVNLMADADELDSLAGSDVLQWHWAVGDFSFCDVGLVLLLVTESGRVLG